MRNLKRALSLTLASVMLLGMMVVGTSAASYPDVDAEDNVEAIEVVQAVGVMVGDERGNFNPGTQVTRNEMAVIMAKLILGPDLAETYVGICPFWDVPDWAQKYVAACYDNGIVAGIGGGAYGGDQTVTAEQAAAMMLRALGYSKLTDDSGDWARPVVAKASQIQLFTGVGTNPKEVLNRNQVAQLTLNTLESGMVEMQDNTMNITGGGSDISFNITGGQVSYVYVTSNATYADAIDDMGASSIGSQNDGSIVELGEKLYNGSLKKYGDETNSRTEETDPMGRPAVRWVFENKEIGTYVKGSELKFSFTAKAAKGDMYTQIGASVADALRNGEDSKYTLEVWVDGAKLDTPVDAKNYFEKNSSSAAGVKSAASGGVAGGTVYAGQSGNGVLTEVFVVDGKPGDPDNVIIVMTNTYLVKATSDYNSTKETVNVEPVEINDDASANPGEYPIGAIGFETSISSDDFDVSGVKEGDYLLVTWSYNENGYVTVKPAELLSGKVSEYTVSENVIIDGTKYSYGKIVGKNQKSDEFSINQDAKVVLDAYGYIIYVDEAISTNSFVYIQKAAGATGLNKKGVAAAYFGDGTYAEIDVRKVIDAGGTEHTDGTWLSDSANVHGWYTYIKDSNGQYILTAADRTGNRTTGSVKNASVDSSNVATQIVFNSKIAFMAASTDDNIKDQKNVIANANTVFMVLDSDDEITVTTGVSNAPDVYIGGNNTAVAAGKVEINWVVKDGYAQYVFIDVSDPAAKASVDSAVNAADYLFILKSTNNKTVVDGDTYYKFKVVIDGEETERFIEESNVAQVGQLRYNVKTNSKDYITNASLVTNSSKNTHNAVTLDGSTITQKGRNINIAGKEYIIAENADLNLVVGKGVTELLRDSGADYELYLHTTAATIAGLVGQLPADKGVDGSAYAVVTENGSQVLEVLWVYISDVSDAKAVVESGSNGDAIKDALDNNPGGAAVTDPTLDEAITVGKDQTLTLGGTVSTSGGSVAANDENAAVVVKDATVNDDLTITASGANSTVTVDGTALDGELTINASGSGSSVVVKDAAVNADLTITGKTTLDAVTVDDSTTVTVTGAATVSGTVSLGAGAELEITGEITAASGAAIVPETDAVLKVGTESAGTTAALKALTGPFLKADGTEYAANETIAPGTYVWSDDWSLLERTAQPGWKLQGGGNVGDETYDVTGIDTPADVTNGEGMTYTVSASPTSGVTGTAVTLTATLSAEVPANKEVTITFSAPSGKTITIAAGDTTGTTTFDIGSANVQVAVTSAVLGDAASADEQAVAAAKAAIEALVDDGAEIEAAATALDADGIKAAVIALLTSDVLGTATVDTSEGTDGYTWTTVTAAVNGSHDKTDDSKLAGTDGTVTVTIALVSGEATGTATITNLPVKAKAYTRTDAEKVETALVKIAAMTMTADVDVSATENDALTAITAAINAVLDGNGTATVTSTSGQSWTAPSDGGTVTWNVDITVTSGSETDTSLTSQEFTLTGVDTSGN